MRNVLWASLLTAYLPFLWYPAVGQSQGIGVRRIQKPQQTSGSKAEHTDTDQRGTYKRPFVIDTEGHKKSEQEAAETKADKQRRDYIERWTLYYAGAAALGTIGLVIVGAIAAFFANRTLRAIERQGDLMEQQAADARNSSAAASVTATETLRA